MKALFIIALLLAGCGINEPSDEMKEAAYGAGYEIGYAEVCLKQPGPLMIPSDYDDSKGSGILVGNYRAGWADGANRCAK